MQRTPVAVALVAATLAGLCSNAWAADAGKAAPKRPPNILLIIGDDFGLDVTTDMYPGLIDGLVKQYGPTGLKNPNYLAIRGKPASTPVLDNFARQGMTFSNAWAEPFCSVTRSSILSGLFAAKTRVLTYNDGLDTHHLSFVKLLKEQAGYSTGIFGKWHIAGMPGRQVSYPGMKPKQAGFDLFRGNLGAAIKSYWDYEYLVQDGDTAPDKWRSETDPTRSLPGVAATNYAPVVKAADVIEWITSQQKAGKPWFAWMAFNLSHATAQRMPSQMAIPNPDTLDPAAYKELKDCKGVFGSADTGQCSGEAQMRGMTNSADTVIGKVLDAVDKLDPNTYVIYISDNGTPMYGRPKLDFIDNMYLTKKGRGKGTAFESGSRVPMAIRGPGIPKNTNSDAYVDTVDLYSTILDLAGLKAPQMVPNSGGTGMVSLDSVSLAPILLHNAKEVRDPDKGYLLSETVNLMAADKTRQAGARNRDFKVVCTNGYATNDCLFYNVTKDPLEEYPLDKPASCDDYKAGKLKPDQQQWQYCRLIEVVATESFMRPDFVPQTTSLPWTRPEGMLAELLGGEGGPAD
ncbi:MAG TPA: sulfatase-like hydrolase/transferase [Steroidobacteraceae bacterium]|nr:sulfatase-like hydrolase/transferase [Steroidobacteraceae bacterium]